MSEKSWPVLWKKVVTWPKKVVKTPRENFIIKIFDVFGQKKWSFGQKFLKSGQPIFEI